ncbi:MAG: PD-(D/E)XK nuclease family protein [Ilumatobacteraceae bacterium]
MCQLPEDRRPRTIREIGLELKLEAPVGDLTLQGIIDRLELDADGELVVTDYKTGRAPSPNWERRACPACTSTRSCAVGVRQAAGGDPTHVPQVGRDDHGDAERAIHAVPHHPHGAVWKAVATA